MFDTACTSKNRILYSLEIKLGFSEYWFLLLVNCFVFNKITVDFRMTLTKFWRTTLEEFWYNLVLSIPVTQSCCRRSQECFVAGGTGSSRFPTLWAVNYVWVSFLDGTVFESFLLLIGTFGSYSCKYSQ